MACMATQAVMFLMLCFVLFFLQSAAFCFPADPIPPISMAACLALLLVFLKVLCPWRSFAESFPSYRLKNSTPCFANLSGQFVRTHVKSVFIVRFLVALSPEDPLFPFAFGGLIRAGAGWVFLPFLMCLAKQSTLEDCQAEHVFSISIYHSHLFLRG